MKSTETVTAEMLHAGDELHLDDREVDLEDVDGNDHGETAPVQVAELVSIEWDVPGSTLTAVIRPEGVNRTFELTFDADELIAVTA